MPYQDNNNNNNNINSELAKILPVALIINYISNSNNTVFKPSYY